MKKLNRWFWAGMMLISMTLLLAGCSSQGGGSASSGDDDDEVKINVAFLSVATSTTAIKTDNQEAATITANVLDAKRVPVEGATITFDVPAGKISANTVLSDANGEAVVQFSSGGYDKQNQVVPITVASGTLSKVIPVQLQGTTVSLTIDNTSLQGGSDSGSTSLTITVKDGGGIGIFGAEVNISQASEGSASVTLKEGSAAGAGEAAMTGTTDVNGELKVTVTGNNAGDEPVVLTITSLGATATQEVNVSGQPFEFVVLSGEAFVSADSVTTVATGGTINVFVRSPNGNNVRFSTTMGTLASATAVTGNNSAVLVASPDADNIVPATLTAPATAGVATLMAQEENSPSVNDTLRVAVAAPSSEASQISIQAAPTVIPVSSGDLVNVSSLIITVKNATDEVVAGVPVLLRLEATTGGGEYISPPLVYTDSFGKAESTLYAGSLVSDSDGILCVAEIVGKGIESGIPVVISGEASSVAIGVPTHYEAYNESTYRIPITVMATDSNGNPVVGATINLSVWPRIGWVGYGTDEGPVYCNEGGFWNEDANRNEILDAGEDTGKCAAFGNGQLDPAKSAAGSLPRSVTTDDNGLAEFDYFHQKIYSAWTDVELRASTIVYGTETVSTFLYKATYLEADKNFIPSSPWYVNVCCEADPEDCTACSCCDCNP